MSALLLTLAMPTPPSSAEPTLRRRIAEIAVAQTDAVDPSWHPEQRDCAGLIRHAYRVAFREAGITSALWQDQTGTPSAFADVETLLDRSFVLLGRTHATEPRLRSADVVAFRRVHPSGEIRHHLMLVLRSGRRPAAVVYSPGDGSNDIRMGPLQELSLRAPPEWRPVPDNPAFLGFYRYRGFVR